jgi:uncharacterized protein (TIGR00255 family)
MTGYGVADGPVGDGRLAIEIRTVNHRHFNAQFRLPSSLQPLEPELRNRLRERIDRGHVAVTARWGVEPTRPQELRLDLERAKAVMNALTDLKNSLNLHGDIDMGFIARHPDVLNVVTTEAIPVDLDEVGRILDEALAQVRASREREGEQLARDLAARLDALERALADVKQRAPERVTRERDRLRAAVAELLDGRALDEDRLAQEVALLADRLDVTEEIVRLETHLTTFREALASNDAVGRRLAFLGQEMLREVNTIGSKANDAAMTQLVIAMKGELEKVREQVENIE